MVDIAAGGAHSAALTSNGELYTWGKGRYGRLGHGDSEDQSKPKLVSEQTVYQLTVLGARFPEPLDRRNISSAKICWEILGVAGQ